MNESSITCQVAGCQYEDPHWLGEHLATAHGMSPAAYLATYPGARVASDTLKKRVESVAGKVRRALPPEPSKLTVNFAGLHFPVHPGVPEEACLPMPANYHLPMYPPLSLDVMNCLVALFNGRSIYVWGLPGTGKDALFHAFSAQTRRPAIIKQVIPGSDIESWFFSRGFNEHGTHWEEGDVLKALRDGYVCEDGTRVPYLLLCSDLDRADRAQAEYLRLITDSIRCRVSGPTGTVYNLLPGTQVVATANTAGGGDERGRMISANPLDASILDRFERKFEFHSMNWRDEEPIVKAKFPYLVERAPGVFAQMGKATEAIRKAIEGEELHAEFSHRALCAVLGHAEDLLRASQGGKPPANLLKQAARAWWDGLPDRESRMKARACMDPHIKGGMVNEGHKSHIKGDPLADL